MKPATPPERRAGVAPVLVQKGTRPEVSEEDVATAEEPPLPPVAEIVTGEEPITVKEVQEAEPEQEAVVVATLERALVPFPYRSSAELKVALPVPPC